MRTLAALVLLFSAQAFACPDLTGAYTCKYQDGASEVVTVSQDNKDGVVTYNYNGSQIPADNQTYKVPDDQQLKDGQFRAWCEDDVTLKTELTGKYWNNGSYFGDLVMNMNLSLDSTNLKNVVTGNIKNSGGTYPIDNNIVCTRNP